MRNEGNNLDDYDMLIAYKEDGTKIAAYGFQEQFYVGQGYSVRPITDEERAAYNEHVAWISQTVRAT